MNLYPPPQLQPFSSNKDHSLNPGNRAACGWVTDSTFTPCLQSGAGGKPLLPSRVSKTLCMCAWKKVILYHPQKAALSIEFFQQCSFLETTIKNPGCRIFSLHTSLHKKGAPNVFFLEAGFPAMSSDLGEWEYQYSRMFNLENFEIYLGYHWSVSSTLITLLPYTYSHWL